MLFLAQRETSRIIGLIPFTHARRRHSQTFIAKWRKASGSERANHQLFITELCEVLGCDKPGASNIPPNPEGDSHATPGS